MTNLNEITYADWQFKLNQIGEVAEGVEDINQCIGLILTTPKGSVPHRPTFGSEIHKYIDNPVTSAKAMIIRETIDAINEWESRVVVDSVSIDISDSNLKISIQWSLTEDSITKGSTEVLL